MGRSTAGYEVNLGLDPEDAHLAPTERLLHQVEWKALSEVSDHRQVRQVVRFLREGTKGLLRGAEIDPAQPLRDLTHFRIHTGTGNTDRAITWYKNTPAAMEMWEKMTFYRAMAQKYGVELFRTSTVGVPGRVVSEDEFQIAAVDSRHEGEAFLTERLG